MPVGGATPVGALGYVHAADELLAQMPTPPDWIVHRRRQRRHARGAARRTAARGARARHRCLAPADAARRQRAAPRREDRRARAAARRPAGEVIIADHCGPHYASITNEARYAVRLAARTEALLLDPVYTGKAMAGLIAAVNGGRITGTVVFLHTGGAVALFADEFAEF